MNGVKNETHAANCPVCGEPMQKRSVWMCVGCNGRGKA